MLAPLCAVLAAVTAVVTVGCSPAADGPQAAAPGKQRDLSYAEQITVERGEEILVGTCMRKHGFRYWTGLIASVADRQGHGYVLTDVAWAKRYGYGRELRERAERARLAHRNTAYARKLTERDLVRYNEALDGTLDKGVVKVELPTGGTVWTPRDGCRATAMKELYGDLPTWFRAKKTAQSLTALYAPDIVADPRFTRAVHAWAACMRDAGAAPTRRCPACPASGRWPNGSGPRASRWNCGPRELPGRWRPVSTCARTAWCRRH